MVKKKKGFTLAEVLITLSIVGVIAVLTVPSVMKNYRYKTYTASLQKTYSQITDAVQAIMNDEMTTDFSQTTASVINDCTAGAEKGPCYFLRNYFKVANECGAGGFNTPCTGEAYKSFFGDDAQTFGRDFCIRTTNGATICMRYDPENQAKTFFLDINGPSAPNITGLDAFVIQVLNDGSVVDWSGDSARCNTKSSEYNNIADYAAGCFTQVMNDGWVIDDTKWTKTETEDDDENKDETK